MKERNMLVSRLYVPFHSHFSQVELFSAISEDTCFNPIQASVVRFGRAAFTEPENVEYFMILQCLDKFAIPATTWTASEEQWEGEIWSLMHACFSALYHS